jgi:hypothetical protein|tara:strand:- start:4550 stop:4933 length:384 start_codon:yes stop_codon:yes gene_type:complete
MKDNIYIKALIKDGELHFPIKAIETKYKKFLSQLPNDSKLEIFIGVSGNKGSNPQLARLHAMIREIAQEIGYTFIEAKIEVKRAAGLCFVKNKEEYCKSFADCDKDELNLAIQACVEIGKFNNMNLR